MKFEEIPMLTPSGSYEVNVPLDQLEKHISGYQQENDPSLPVLNFTPDFQRGHVWTKAQQIAYVEFFLRGGMTGRVIYLNYPNWGHFNVIRPGQYGEFVIVDGLQRLTALLKFVKGELPAFGHYVWRPDLAEDNDFNKGKLFFADRVRKADANGNLKINVNNLKTRDAVLRWYLEMNSGGTPHTKTELEKVRKMIEEEKCK